MAWGSPAFIAGKEAYYEGKCRHDNPYNWNSFFAEVREKYNDWDAGMSRAIAVDSDLFNRESTINQYNNG